MQCAGCFCTEWWSNQGRCYFNQRVVGLKKAGIAGAEVTSRFSDVNVQGIKVIGPMNEKDLRYLAKLAKGGTLNDLHSANLTDAVVETSQKGASRTSLISCISTFLHH